MKKLTMYVFGEYYFDSRVKKKAKSLSKKYKVKIISIIEKKEKNKFECFEKINKNIVVQRYYISKFLYKTRFIFNKFILKNIIKKNKSDIVDCNDPDTMYAGYLSKKLYNSKIVYDSHELWKYIFGKKNNILKTIYSFIYSKRMYFLEKKYINFFDNIITVSKPISELLIFNYKLNNVYIIPNYDFYKNNNFIEYSERNREIIFIGNYRYGVEDKLNLIYNKLNIKPIIIGFQGNYKNIDYKGRLRPEKFKEIIKNSMIGFVYLNFENYNVLYSCSNKINQYIQNNLPFISVSNQIYNLYSNKGLGETYNFYDDNELIFKIKKMLDPKNYNNYLKNIKKYKKELSWEAQEKKLFKIYEFD